MMFFCDSSGCTLEVFIKCLPLKVSKIEASLEMHFSIMVTAVQKSGYR